MDLDPSLLAQAKLALASFFGGMVRLFLRPAASLLQSVGLVLSCVVCGYYFTPPVMMYFELQADWSGAVGALIGLAGLSIAEAVIGLNYREMLHSAWNAGIEATVGMFAKKDSKAKKTKKTKD